MRSVTAGAALVLGAALFALRAGAAPALPLDYSAPGACLDRASFLSEVEQRLPRSTVSVRQVEVAIEPAHLEFVARLVVTDAGGTVAEREIAGATCKEVASAMAVVVALVLTELSGQAASLPAPRPKAAGPAGAASPTTTAPGAPPAANHAPPPDPASTATGERLPWGVGILATASGGMAPGVAWGGLAYVELGGLGHPSARLDLGARATPSVREGPGSARFEWIGGRLDGCWPVVAFGADAGIGGCAMVEAGALRGRGSDIDTAYSTVDPWVAIGLLLRPALRAGSVILQAEVGPTFPLVRQTFVFGSGEPYEAVIHETPWVSWQLGAGAGLEW